jgi:hypothetical protein
VVAGDGFETIKGVSQQIYSASKGAVFLRLEELESAIKENPFSGVSEAQ